jgi:EAL and modified HD-GYP domain-containing signal transduction protein
MSDEPGKRAYYIDTFFARQPIFDRDNKVYGYELLYRHNSRAEKAMYSDKDMATLNVISSALLTSSGQEQTNQKILIHFSPVSLLSGMQAALPPATTVVELKCQRKLGQDTARALEKLKAQGFQLAINNYLGGSCDKHLLKLADLVLINLLEVKEEDLAPMVEEVSKDSCLIGAKCVEDIEHFELAKKLGFQLFQGFFFEKPTIIPGRKLHPNHAARLNLHRSLERKNLDVDELTQIIESDVALSFHLLSYINSLAFSLRYRVTSIKHAIMLLGWKQVRNWLWLVTISDLVSPGKSWELPYLSAIRAKFLERASLSVQATEVQPGTVFLMGLFSLLEPMLDTPMNELVETLPLEQEVKEALSGQFNDYTDWLEMARCFESGDWNKLDGLTTKLGLDPIKLASAYCEALAWAKELYEPQQPGTGPE